MEKKGRKVIGLRKDLPPVGTKLIGKFKGNIYYAKVITDKNEPDGKAVEYYGKKYRSMTAAAMAVTRNPVNGWKFWKIQEKG